MKKIDVLTAQNVSINYELASAFLRAVASVIDIIVLFLYLIIVSSIVQVSTFDFEALERSVVLYLFFGWGIFLVYSPVCEILFKGQTLGKRIVGIRVVQINGEKITVEQALIRWVFRIVDLWMSFGAIAVLSNSASSKGQRLGDQLARTTVIRTSPATAYTLRDVQNIKTKSDYTPQYQGVTAFNDDDMMLIKKALSRLEKTPNQQHKDICLALADKCAQKLNLPETPKKKGKFLKTLLNDYIVLTR